MNSIQNICIYMIGSSIGFGSLIYIYQDVNKLNNYKKRIKEDKINVLLDKIYNTLKDNDKVF